MKKTLQALYAKLQIVLAQEEGQDLGNLCTSSESLV